MAGLFGLPVPFVAALGYAAVFMALPIPSSSLLLLEEKFLDSESIPYFFIVCTHFLCV